MKFNLKATLTKEDTKDKYIFWDIDGTLAPYRFNNHVGDPEGTNSGMSLKEIEDGIFLERKPSKHMQKVIEECGAKENIIMSHCINEFECAGLKIAMENAEEKLKEKADFITASNNDNGVAKAIQKFVFNEI